MQTTVISTGESRKRKRTKGAQQKIMNQKNAPSSTFRREGLALRLEKKESPKSGNPPQPPVFEDVQSVHSRRPTHGAEEQKTREVRTETVASRKNDEGA